MYVCTYIHLFYITQPAIFTLYQYNDLIHPLSALPQKRASLVAQRVKRRPAIRETRVKSLSREDPLEKEMAIHSSTLAWKIPWIEKPGRLRSLGLQNQTRLRDFTFTFLLSTRVTRVQVVCFCLPVVLRYLAGYACSVNSCLIFCIIFKLSKKSLQWKLIRKHKHLALDKSQI